MRRPTIVLTGLAACMLSACLHGGFAAPDDPVDEVAARLTDLMAPRPGALCAADRVELERTFVAWRGPVEGPSRTDALRRDAQRQALASTMDFSQRSAAMADAYRISQESRSRTPGDAVAQARIAQASEAFGRYADARPGSVGPGARSATTASAPEDIDPLAQAYFAMVWTAFLGTPSGSPEYDVFLDWLTQQSMHHPRLLRSYHDEFRGALDEACR